MPLSYDDVHLIADPLYGYLHITTPRDETEVTETDIIDDPWVQRLKRIHQLQSSWWVFPTAEHSRFAHSLGVMHLAGTLATHVYPSLAEVLVREGAQPLPSRPLVEETLRLAGLLHDVGHGPFSHFFDEQYLHPKWGLDHEQLGQRLIVQELGVAIAALQRSPDGAFEPGERVEPAHVAYLIRDEDSAVAGAGGARPSSAGPAPRWVRLLRRALAGAVTVDNMDYVRRDAYMCGVSLGAVDVDRLLYYTFCGEDGLTYHKRALGALRAFLNARFYLYENIYFHRVGGAIDMHLREIFADTMELVLPTSPLEDMEAYRKLTEWSLFEQVDGWMEEPAGTPRRRLAEEWQQIIHRNVKYHAVFEQSVERRQIAPATRELTGEEFAAAIRRALPPQLKEMPFAVDVASQDPRPLNPLRGSKRLPVYDPVTGRVEDDLLSGIIDFIPAKAHIYRVYSVLRENERDLAEAAKAALGEVAASSLTNL
jgi:HD superfamily phosphohydrolase